MNVCFYKSDVWGYEREWRCVRKFDVKEPRAVGIEPRLITQIIFGFQMEPWQIARIMLYTTAYEMTRTQYLVSAPASTSWTMESRPKKMSLCPKCEGNGYLMEG